MSRPRDQWERGTAMLHAMMRRVRRGPFLFGLVRLYHLALEVTCASREVPLLRKWLREHGMASMNLQLPVPEYVRAPWGPEYRWTASAARHYEDHGGKWAPIRPRGGPPDPESDVGKLPPEGERGGSAA